ncbi:MAG TPA: alpha/beta hydrolase [Candidatus Elarobacter sp.]|jgi:pimeloyl-ACP methyl ester carboxylesterase|nr:alpha/beta hydrolase [Candidatus Elarobacter sp.]
MQRAHERALPLSDGAKTVVETWGAQGPLIVGVHGLGGSRRGWARIAEHLAERYRVVAYDQRGHGDSGAKGPMTFERGLQDLEEVVASLGEPVRALVGHSWGGAVVVAGGRRIGAVGRVAAIDPMLRVDEGVWTKNVLPEYQKMFAQTLEEREASIRASYAALPGIEVESKLHATRRLTYDPVAALGAENEIDAGKWDFRELVRDYPKPLLIAVADPKRSVVPEAEREEYRARGGANVRVEVFAGASHSLQRDAFDRFIPVLEEFLAA